MVLLLSSCAGSKLERMDKIDSDAGLTATDYEKILLKKTTSAADKAAAVQKEKDQESADKFSVPSFSPMVTQPKTPMAAGDKVISLAVTEDVPLKDVLIELGRLAKIDVDIDPTIAGGIILNAKNRPLKEVLDRIAALGRLKYTYKNGVLNFKPDTPYMQNYFVDYLTEGSSVWSDVETNLQTIIQNADSSEGAPPASASLNKSAGIISLFAGEAQHKSVQAYLDDVYKYASAQVLIEAKIIEVTLNKEFQSGINWSSIGNMALNTSVDIAGSTFKLSPNGGTSSSPITFKLFGSDITTAVKALEKFGTSRGISSPRLHAMNNQKASLDFSEKLIYFTVSSSQVTTPSTSGAVTNSNVTATKNEIPVGVQLEITPSINLKTNEITMGINPTITVDSGERAKDPSVNPNTGASLGNEVPIIKTRKINTIAKIGSGEILVIGGLLQESADNSDTGVPFLEKIPVLGYLFKYASRSNKVIETIIFVKATIVENGKESLGKYDRSFLDNFSTSKRKF